MKKILSLILAVVMIALMIPISAIPLSAASAGVNVNTPIPGMTLYNYSKASAVVETETVETVKKDYITYQGRGSLWLNADTGTDARTITVKIARTSTSTTLGYLTLFTTNTNPSELTQFRNFNEFGLGIYKSTGQIYCGVYGGGGTSDYSWSYYNASQNKDYFVNNSDNPYTSDALAIANSPVFTFTMVVGSDNYLDTFTVKSDYVKDEKACVSEWGIDFTIDGAPQISVGKYIGIGCGNYNTAVSSHQRLISASVTDTKGNSLLPEFMSLPFSQWNATPTSVSYSRYDKVSDSASGKVTIKLPENHYTEKVKLYWGAVDAKLAGYDAFATVDVPSNEVTEVVYEIPEGVDIPKEASQILAYPYDKWRGDGTDCAKTNILGVRMNNPINGFTLYNNDIAKAGLDTANDTIYFQSKGALFLNADTGIGERTVEFKLRVLGNNCQQLSIQSTFTHPTQITSYRPTPEIYFTNMANSDADYLYYHRTSVTDPNGNAHSAVDATGYLPTTGEVDTASFGSSVGAIFTIQIKVGADNYIDTVSFNAAYKNAEGTDVSSDWSYDWSEYNYNLGNYIGIDAKTRYIANSKVEIISAKVTDKDGKSLLPAYMSLPFSQWDDKAELKLPTSVNYALDDASSGLADGKVTIDLPEYHNAEKLNFYWGDANGKLAGYNSIGSAAVASKETRQVVYDMIPSTMIPPTATKLLVYPYDSWNGESTDCTAFDLTTGSSYVMPEEAALSEFYVISDTHYGRSDAYDAQVKTALDYIAANKKNASGLFIVGDAIQGAVNDSSVAVTQYADFAALCESIDGLPNIYPAVGNHEFFGWYSSKDHQGAIDAFVDNIKTNYSHIELEEGETAKPYYDVELNGYQFIVLGATSQINATEGYLGDEQLTWLEAKLAAASDNSPVFIMCHRSITNSVAQKVSDGSDEWADILDGEKLRVILNKYPNVVMFNGHTHYSLTGRTVKHMIGGGDEYVTFNTASVKDNLQGYYVSVYSDRVLVRGIDFETGEWISAAQFVVEERYTGVPLESKKPQYRDDMSDANGNYTGIRFLTEFNADRLNMLVSMYEGNRITMIECGTLITTKDWAEAAGGVTFEALDNIRGDRVAYINVQATLKDWYTTDTFAGTVVTSNEAREYWAAGYVKITYANGDVLISYSNSQAATLATAERVVTGGN